MAGPVVVITGVTFDSVRLALTDLYFRHSKMHPDSEEGRRAFEEAMQFVVPMRHNFANPINPGTQDTWIQYWVDTDDRLTHDRSLHNMNVTQKLARVSLRFLGARAEVWAKSFHHLTKHKYCEIIFNRYCNAMLLPYVSPIVPRNVDYFGSGNTTIAFSLSFSLQYDEVLDYTVGSGGDELEYISFAAGTIINEESVEGGIG